jgi:hypothetical protein
MYSKGYIIGFYVPLMLSTFLLLKSKCRVDIFFIMIVTYCKVLRFNFFYFVILQPHGHYAPSWPVCLFFHFSENWQVIVPVMLTSLTNADPVPRTPGSLLPAGGCRSPGWTLGKHPLFVFKLFSRFDFFRQNEITNFNKKFQEESLPSPAEILND